MVREKIKKQQMTLTDRLRIVFKGVLDPIGEFLNGLGLTPNTMTLLGLMGNVIGAVFLAYGQLTVGGLIILAMGPFDALDGTMARLRGEPSHWGGFVDSVVDRYSELALFGGLLYYFLQQGNLAAAGWVYAAAAGAVLVSYVRARAQSLGFDVKAGFFSRLERYMILVPALVFNFPVIGMIILAIGAHFTALQRIYAFRVQVK